MTILPKMAEFEAMTVEAIGGEQDQNFIRSLQRERRVTEIKK
jgi:hypothetical protein